MITLKAEKRNPNVKAKKLRREGYVTGILSGKEMKEPVALQFDGAEAAKFIKANKEGTQIYLEERQVLSMNILFLFDSDMRGDGKYPYC